MSRATLAHNLHLAQRHIKEMVDFGPDVVPMTENMTCIFLSPTFGCIIYDQRPDVCKKYGDETHLLMTCAYQKADGTARTRSERKRIEREQEKSIKNR